MAVDRSVTDSIALCCSPDAESVAGGARVELLLAQLHAEGAHPQGADGPAAEGQRPRGRGHQHHQLRHHRQLGRRLAQRR